jgi:CBS domain containing-hemolysin-like protein
MMWLRDASTQLVFRLLGRSMKPESAVTEEVRTIVAEAENADAVEIRRWRFEAIDMEGRRIDKVLARRDSEEASQIPATATTY